MSSIRLAGGMAIAGAAGIGIGLAMGNEITGEWSRDHEGDRVIGLLAGVGGTAYGATIASAGARDVLRAWSSGAPAPADPLLRAILGAAVVGGALGFTLTASIT